MTSHLLLSLLFLGAPSQPPADLYVLRKVLVFRSEGSRPLALAVWEPDPRCEVMCCEASFSLFALGPEGALQRLEDNGYDCDV